MAATRTAKVCPRRYPARGQDASLEGGGGRLLGSGAWAGRRRDGFGPGYGGRKQAPDNEKGERRRRAPMKA